MATENQQTNKPNKIAKAYKAAHQFVADKSNIISPLTDIIPNPETTQNETQQVSQQIYGIGSKLLLSNPITSWIGLGMIGAQKANLNTIATDFNDDFGNSNNLSFLENTGNLLGSLTPFGKLFGTEINPVDKSRLAGSSMYNWYSDFDKYNNNNKPFSVWFGGDKLKNESANQQLKVDTAVGIRDEGARAMKFDPYRVAKQTDNQLRHAFDPRYNLGPSGKNGMKLQFAKRTISKHNIKKHQIGGKAENISLPKWLFYDDEKNEYVSDFYESSPKENIQDLNKYVKENLPGWKVWKSLEGQRRYFVLPEKEANRRDMQILKQIEANSMSGSVGSKPAPPIGDSIGIDNKELTYVGNQVGDNGKPYNFEDENGVTYWFPEYQKNGGKVNVIPSGALHAHKHNLTKVAEDGEKFEDVTTKGIPVVVEDEKGNLIQQAEVEREEIIFRLEVTKKLEELMKKGTDEAAIEAGKLLAYEIVENTQDNTNIMI